MDLVEKRCHLNLLQQRCPLLLQGGHSILLTSDHTHIRQDLANYQEVVIVLRGHPHLLGQKPQNGVKDTNHTHRKDPRLYYPERFAPWKTFLKPSWWKIFSKVFFFENYWASIFGTTVFLESWSEVTTLQKQSIICSIFSIPQEPPPQVFFCLTLKMKCIALIPLVYTSNSLSITKMIK